jgi:peptide/nickel transport system substrate-binding protein
MVKLRDPGTLGCGDHPVTARAVRLLVLTLASVLVLLACSPDPTSLDPADQTLRVGASLEPPTLDPTGSDAASIPQALLYNVYETLVKINTDGEIRPLLAQRWEISKDHTRYTFTLANAAFASGRPVTSEDVAWSIKKVRGGHNIAAASQLSVIKSVDTVDASTVVFRLSRPSNSWLFAMASTAGIIFDSHSTSDFATVPAGSGPYRLERWTKGSHLALARNDVYWQARPAFASVTFRYFGDPNAMNSALLSGGLDVITNLQVPHTLPQFADPSRFRVTEGTTNGEVVMALNNSVRPLRDKRVRQAINYAVDRRALVDTVWNGKGTLIGSMVPPTDPWYTDLSKTYPYDSAKARQLLADAGYATGLRLRMRVPVVPYATASSQFVASQLSDVGIQVSIEELEFPRWLDQVFTKADYDISIVAHVEARDIVRFADPRYYFRYDNPAVTRLVAEADAGSETAQIAKMKQVALILAQDAAADWLFLLPNLAVSTAEVTGVPKNATTLSFDLFTINKSN